MAQSLFQRKSTEQAGPPSNFELIEPEIVHLKKGYSVRYGPKPPKRSVWLAVLGFCGLAFLYLQDPILHCYYKNEAIKAYLYLHNYGAGPEANQLAGCGILSPDDIKLLNDQHGAYQDSYPTPQAAAKAATKIVGYTVQVKLLHQGRYEELDPLGRMRYLLFIRTGLYLPISWDFLDPSVNP